jgi:hypothetical protein
LEGLAIVPRDAIAIAAIAQPRPEFLIAKALTCIVQDVDEFERAFNPKIVAFSLLLQTVFDLPPSEVEFAFDIRVDVGRRSGVCGVLLCHFMPPNFAHCAARLALAANGC